MKAYDIKCPICGTVNKQLYLEETNGWMECEHCGNAVDMSKYVNWRLIPFPLTKLLSPPQRNDKKKSFADKNRIPVTVVSQDTY